MARPLWNQCTEAASFVPDWLFYVLKLLVCINVENTLWQKVGVDTFTQSTRWWQPSPRPVTVDCNLLDLLYVQVKKNNEAM